VPQLYDGYQAVGYDAIAGESVPKDETSPCSSASADADGDADGLADSDRAASPTATGTAVAALSAGAHRVLRAAAKAAL
jgi:hypothetical protein